MGQAGSLLADWQSAMPALSPAAPSFPPNSATGILAKPPRQERSLPPPTQPTWKGVSSVTHRSVTPKTFVRVMPSQARLPYCLCKE